MIPQYSHILLVRCKYKVSCIRPHLPLYVRYSVMKGKEKIKQLNYSRLSLNGHLYKTDISVKLTPS